MAVAKARLRRARRGAGNAGLIRHRSGVADYEDVGMARHRQIDADLHPLCAIVFRIEPACRRRGHQTGRRVDAWVMFGFGELRT